MLLVCVSCREVWLLPGVLDSLVVTHTVRNMSANLCTCTQWLPGYISTFEYCLHLHGLSASPQCSWPHRSAPAVQCLLPKKLNNIAPIMHQYSRQNWLWRLPQPNTPTSHAAMVRQEHQPQTEGPHVCLRSACPSHLTHTFPMHAAFDGVLFQLQLQLWGSSIRPVTHAQLGLLMQATKTVLQQLNGQILFRGPSCCNSDCKPMHLNSCYIRYACVRPISSVAVW